MRKLLLSLMIVSAAGALTAQTYRPSGKIVAPSWGYSDVVNGSGNFGNPKTGNSGSVIEDADLMLKNVTLGDAYDGAFEFFVNKSDSVYTESGFTTGGVDTVGTTISLAEQFIDGFFVSKKYYFSPAEPVIRVIFKIRNPSLAERSTKIGIYSDLGSDSDTKMDTSSTDGLTLAEADRWMVTTDGYVSGDPIITWVRFGSGAIRSSPIFGLKPEGGSDEYVDTLAVTVPANAYVLIMQFNRMDSSIAAARNNAAKFNSIATLKASNYLDGLTRSELQSIVNWDFSPIVVDNPQVICENGAYTFNGHTYTVPATYHDTLQTVSGRDSIISTQLTVNSIDKTTAISGNTITSNQAGATYKWIDCSNNADIPNATSQAYTVSQSGNYAVMVTKGACSAKSTCSNVIYTGVDSSPMDKMAIYPNPSKGLFTIDASDIKDIKIFNTLGKIVYQAAGSEVNPTVDITREVAGTYLLQITTSAGLTKHKIIKQ